MARLQGLKRQVRGILADAAWESRLHELDAIPPRQLSGPLFTLLLDRDEAIRWRAVVAFGSAIARLAEQGPEQARVLMRTCMWRMNEESGGLGWGIPETMAEAMARHAGLAGEYHAILASYVLPEEPGREGNFLEHAPMRRGVFWGLGRLARARPELVRRAVPALLAGLSDVDAGNRGLAAWALGALKCREALEALRGLAADASEAAIFRNGRVEAASVGGLAREALAAIGAQA